MVVILLVTELDTAAKEDVEAKLEEGQPDKS
jgi:hypothetical protein